MNMRMGELGGLKGEFMDWIFRMIVKMQVGKEFDNLE